MVVRKSIVILFGVLFIASFASAGLLEWFGNITGKATSDSAALNITVGNNAPTITDVSYSSAQGPSEAGMRVITFTFNVTDADGVSNLDDNTAKAQFDRAGEVSRFNDSCVWIADRTANMAEYSCSVSLWYFDGSGDWTVNVSALDINGAEARDESEIFTYNLLTSMVMAPAALGWGALGVANTNIGSNNDPIVVNNTGNDEGLTLNVTGKHLQGEETPSEYIYANNFSVGITTEGCTGVVMGDSISLEITSSILERGNNSIDAGDDTSGQEELFFCLRGLPSTISSQSYSSAGTGPWLIQVLT